MHYTHGVYKGSIRGHWIPGTGIIGCFKPADVGSGNPCPLQEHHVFLNPELLVQPIMKLLLLLDFMPVIFRTGSLSSPSKSVTYLKLTWNSKQSSLPPLRHQLVSCGENAKILFFSSYEICNAL